jgi:lipoprotein-anchoring transpeptidase ErfK/SrfK
MRRIVMSAASVLATAACSTSFLIATNASAAAQFLDPGWQLGYVVPSGRGGGGGGLASIYGDGPAPMVAYQQAPMYQAPMYQQAPMYRPAPMYQQAPMYQPMPVYRPAPQARAYMPGPVYYQAAVAPQPRYQPTSAYYQSAYYQQTPAAQAYQQRTPVYYAQAPVMPARPSQKTASFQLAQTRPQAEPQYTGSIQSAPAAPQPAVAQQAMPQQGFFQTSSSWHRPDAQPPAVAAPPQGTAAPALVPQEAARQDSFHPGPPRVVAWGMQQPAYAPPAYAPSTYGDMARPMADPRYERQVVDYHTDQTPGTVVVDTQHYFLYLVMDGGKALRYGIGVGREGFTWSGVNEISAMREWPDWVPPPEMLQRRPDLPRYVAGGVDNPLGARALYLGSTLYRIHGSNEPWTIGTNVSSGCIRLRNADIEDLYSRVKVGTKVVVL